MLKFSKSLHFQNSNDKNVHGQQITVSKHLKIHTVEGCIALKASLRYRCFINEIVNFTIVISYKVAFVYYDIVCMK